MPWIIGKGMLYAGEGRYVRSVGEAAQYESEEDAWKAAFGDRERIGCTFVQEITSEGLGVKKFTKVTTMERLHLNKTPTSIMDNILYLK